MIPCGHSDECHSIEQLFIIRMIVLRVDSWDAMCSALRTCGRGDLFLCQNSDTTGAHLPVTFTPQGVFGEVLGPQAGGGRYPALQGRGPQISDMSELRWGVPAVALPDEEDGHPFGAQTG